MGRSSLQLHVGEDLRFFLPARSRSGAVEVPVDGTSTLGHLVQSAGVPLTEVGTLRAGAQVLGPEFRPSGGEVVAVLSASRPQLLPAGPRFLLDVHLGTLARRLRLLGLDTLYHPDASDEALAAQALAEARMLLTQDRGLLKRTALRRTAAFVRGSRVDDQLGDVLDRFRPTLRPYTRCVACNGLLVDVAKDDVRHRLEPGTERSYDEFTQCTGCDRVYWRGAHAARLAVLLDRAGIAPVDSRPPGPPDTGAIVVHDRGEAP